MNNPKDATPGQIWAALHDPKIAKYKTSLGGYCKKCVTFHETFCKEATHKEIVDGLASLLRQSKLAGECRDKWYQRAKDMAGKFAIVKHENNRLRKKYESERFKAEILQTKVHELESIIKKQDELLRKWVPGLNPNIT